MDTGNPDGKNDGPADGDGPVTKKPGARVLGLALLAGVLGIGAGAGLYFLNNSGSSEQVAAAGSGTCAYSEARRTALDKAAQGEVAAFRALDRAYSASELGFADKGGQAKTLADWNGRVTLVNLWATWCAPCRAEMPALDELQAQMGGDTFEVVPISVDLGDDAKPKAFFDEINIKHMGFFHDGDMSSLNTLKKAGLAYGLPATLLIDGKGCVLGALNGPAEWAGEDAKRLVNAAL